MRIRDACAEDAPAIDRVLVDSCQAAYADVLDDDAFLERVADQDVDELAERLAAVAEDDEIVYLVAERAGEVEGFAQLLAGNRRPDHVDPGTAYLKSLYVAPDHWGEGIGTGLLDEARSRLPDEAERVELAVFSANHLGKGFYERYGFEQVGDGSFDVGDVSYGTDVYRLDRG